jgi:hypothetical protein
MRQITYCKPYLPKDAHDVRFIIRDAPAPVATGIEFDTEKLAIAHVELALAKVGASKVRVCEGDDMSWSAVWFWNLDGLTPGVGCFQVANIYVTYEERL